MSLAAATSSHCRDEALVVPPEKRDAPRQQNAQQGHKNLVEAAGDDKQALLLHAPCPSPPLLGQAATSSCGGSEFQALSPYSRLHPHLTTKHHHTAHPHTTTQKETYHETREDRPLASHARALSNSGACGKERRRSRGYLLFLFACCGREKRRGKEMSAGQRQACIQTLPKQCQEG